MEELKMLGINPEDLTIFKETDDNKLRINGPYVVIYEDSDDNKIWCTVDGTYIDFIKGGDSGCEVGIYDVDELVYEYNYFCNRFKLDEEQEVILLQYLRMNLDYHSHKYVEDDKDLITLQEVVTFLKDIDSPLGDLCTDILDDKNFPFNDVESSWKYLNEIRQNKEYLDEPIRRLKTIYSTIARS